MGWLTGVAVAWALLGTAAQAETCVSSSAEISGRTGEIASVRLEATAGAVCISRIIGPRRNPRVDQRPQHGRVDIADTGEVFYTADPNYAGPDVFRVTWFSEGATARRGVDVLVTVLPAASAVLPPPPAPAAPAPAAPAPAGPAPRASAAPASAATGPAKPASRRPAAAGPDGLGLYGMLVYSREARTYGFAVNQSSVDAALRAAMRQCGRGDCVVMTPIRSEECVAFAVGDADRSWLRTRGSDPSARVLERCQQRTTNCQIVVARCM